MSAVSTNLFRGSVLVGSMVLADGIVGLLCPNARGVVKFAACLAAVTMCGAAADAGARHAIKVLEEAKARIEVH